VTSADLQLSACFEMAGGDKHARTDIVASRALRKSGCTYTKNIMLENYCAVRRRGAVLDFSPPEVFHCSSRPAAGLEFN